MESYMAFVSKYSKQMVWMPSMLGRMAAPKAANIVPEGFLAVYVGEERKRHVIPLAYINHPSFRSMLTQAEEEFGFSSPLGGLTFPCHEDIFIGVTASILDED
ncbi:hypothetical protein Dimus_025988 [Dionaea muscipula]